MSVAIRTMSRRYMIRSMLPLSCRANSQRIYAAIRGARKRQVRQQLLRVLCCHATASERHYVTPRCLHAMPAGTPPSATTLLLWRQRERRMATLAQTAAVFACFEQKATREERSARYVWLRGRFLPRFFAAPPLSSLRPPRIDAPAVTCVCFRAMSRIPASMIVHEQQRRDMPPLRPIVDPSIVAANPVTA